VVKVTRLNGACLVCCTTCCYVWCGLVVVIIDRMCNVIHIRDKQGTNNEVYIGRGSKWGNPFKIGMDGSRQDVIDKYEARLIQSTVLMDSLLELEGKTLICYCKPQACHGDVLAKYVKELINDMAEESDRRLI
jgi:hypothetical protein